MLCSVTTGSVPLMPLPFEWDNLLFGPAQGGRLIAVA
jgi:hypothetical protein